MTMMMTAAVPSAPSAAASTAATTTTPNNLAASTSPPSSSTTTTTTTTSTSTAAFTPPKRVSSLGFFSTSSPSSTTTTGAAAAPSHLPSPPDSPRHAPPLPTPTNSTQVQQHPVASLFASFGRGYATLMSHPSIGSYARYSLTMACDMARLVVSSRRYAAIDEEKWGFSGYIVLPPEDVRTPRKLSAAQLSELAHADFQADEYLIMYLHGGGFAFGTPTQCLPAIVGIMDQVAELSGNRKIRAVSVGYPHAPDHPFPAALETVVAAYMHLTRERGANPDRLIVMGDSAGVGLALGVLQWLQVSRVEPRPEQQLDGGANAVVSAAVAAAAAMADDEGGEAFSSSHLARRPLSSSSLSSPRNEPACALVLLSPWVEMSTASQSFDANASFDYLPRAVVDKFARMYTGFDDGTPVAGHVAPKKRRRAGHVGASGAGGGLAAEAVEDQAALNAAVVAAATSAAGAGTTVPSAPTGTTAAAAAAVAAAVPAPTTTLPPTPAAGPLSSPPPPSPPPALSPPPPPPPSPPSPPRASAAKMARWGLASPAVHGSHAEAIADPLVSPLRAPASAFAGMVRRHARSGRRPALVAIGGLEVFRDDAERLCERMEQGGLAVRRLREEGQFHCWFSYQTPAATRTFARVAQFLVDDVMV
ncbi:Alpha/Beta hydrolase protein [Zopfochytrium polystomum]|nr:Alpha/Beta hydrolase protein [Zopfochytrium polystomum]